MLSPIYSNLSEIKEHVKRFFGDSYFDELMFFEQAGFLSMRGIKNGHIVDYLFSLDQINAFVPGVLNGILERIKENIDLTVAINK